MKSIAVIVVATCASLYASNWASAQAPPPVVPPVSADTLIVTGIVPVAPGVSVTIEALDPATLRSVECTRGQTVASDAASTTSSQFAFTVERACVQKTSGNLRVCWGEGKCQGFEFQAGRRLDLGVIVLRAPIEQAPDVGSGPDALRAPAQADNSIHALAAAGLALVGVSTLAFGGSLPARVRKRHSR